MSDALAVARIVVGLILAVASVSKWTAFGRFVKVVNDYDLVPPAAAPVVALTIAVCESTIAAMMLAGVFQPWASAAAATLLTVFTGALAINLARGNTHISCGCSGEKHGRFISWRGVVQNLGLLGLAVAPFLTRSSFLSAEIAFLLIGSSLVIVMVPIVISVVSRVRSSADPASPFSPAH